MVAPVKKIAIAEEAGVWTTLRLLCLKLRPAQKNVDSRESVQKPQSRDADSADDLLALWWFDRTDDRF